MKRVNALLAVSLIAILFANAVFAGDEKPIAALKENTPMQLQATYPVVVTDKLVECRDFYVNGFGFQVVFEASRFVYLVSGGNPSYGIAFMAPDHPSQPPGPEKFNGQGVFLTLQVGADELQLTRADSGRRSAYLMYDDELETDND